MNLINAIVIVVLNYLTAIIKALEYNRLLLNWGAIKTCVGFAGHIPHAIEQLNSPIEEERRAAYWMIDNYAIRQSDLYEAAYYVIEPIVELLEEKYTVDRTYPLRILAEIAFGGYYENKVITIGKDEINLFFACRAKLKALKPRIENIIVMNEKEKKELQDLLEEIESSYPNKSSDIAE